MEKRGSNIIPSEEKPNELLDVESLCSILENAPKISSLEELPAPFRDFNKNTDELWNYVLPKEVESYLKKKLFFNTSAIPVESRKKIISIHPEAGTETIKVPLDLVVCAAGFDDWQGRPKGDTKSWEIGQGVQKLGGDMPSLDVNKLYAGTPSDLPSVRAMNMYIQPDKKVFFDNVGGDSHRIAAAILRGNKDVETRNVTIYQLDNNFL